MTIKGTPDSPLPKPQSKRPPDESLEKSGTTKKQSQDEQQGALITDGPFKGLPQPFQKKHHEGLLPYIVCNEKGQETTLAALSSNPSTIDPKRRVHIGFSGWFNLDLMAVTHPAYGILCDYDNKMMDIYRGIGESLNKSANRREFVSNFEMFINENSQQLFSLPPAEIPKLFNIRNELQRPGSWLASEASFQVIKNLSTSGRLIFLNVDITDKQAFIQLKSWLDESHLELDTLYTSNIIDWLQGELPQQSYILNLKMVSTPNTRFIEARSIIPQKSKFAQPKQEPIQHVFKGVGGNKLLPTQQA
ncbi:MAG TPA: hypothetical protein VIJ14_11040 [Rhabdochlamydiaceae bacterium]